jgi:hypothetical protein
VKENAIHKSPWYLPKAVLPEGADRDSAKRLDSGQFTPWFDVAEHDGDRLHERLNRSGGVAEFPNLTADFICDPAADRRTVIIQLATADSADHVVRQWKESFAGSLTSFLVSPRLARHASSLETAAEMTARRLDWARMATRGMRHSPKYLIVQTSFWGPQRAELNLREAEVLYLLGFNVVGNQRPEVRERFDFHVPGQPSAALAPVFGIAADVQTTARPGRYHIRGALNDMGYLDSIQVAAQPRGDSPSLDLGVIGTKTRLRPTTGLVAGSFGDGSPAVVKNDFGRGTAQYVGTCPGIAYLKEANFVPAELAEQWPPDHRRFLNQAADARGVRPIVELSHSVVECGVCDAAQGSAVVLANFTYEPIESLQVRLTLPRPARRIRSLEQGQLQFTTEAAVGDPQRRTEVSFQLPLGLTDIVLAE